MEGFTMGKKVLCNAFSLNMLADELKLVLSTVEIKITHISPADVPYDCESSWGHADSARLGSELLGWDIPVCRRNDSLMKGDIAYVGQYIGPRLQEGATELPEGAEIRFLKVEIL